jgi:hypothetical protein
MHKKFDVLKKSQVYKNEVENQLGRIIKIIKTNYSGEYMFDLFKESILLFIIFSCLILYNKIV